MSNTVLLYLLCVSANTDVIIADSYNNKLAFINMLKDFLLLQETTVKIAAYICWEKDEYLALKKALGTEYIINYVTNPNQSESLPNEPLTQHLFLLDLDCEGSQNILQQADEKKLFQQPHSWLILANASMEKLYHSSLDFLVDSKVFVAEEVTFAEFHLRSIYKLSNGSNEFLTNDVGIWRGAEKFVYFNSLSAVRNRTDLMGLTLNISYVITNLDSLNHLTDYRDKHIDGISKLNYIFMHHITDVMNASRNFIMQSTWGYKNETTQLYSGLIGDLQREVVELGGTPSFFTRDRIPIIDYIAPTTPTRAKFIFRSPPLSYITNVYYLPFSEMVWYANFLLIGLIALIVYVIVKWEWKDPQFRNVVETRHGALRPSFMDVVLLELGAICQQGSEAEPRSIAGRITTILVFMALMFMYTSYSANIVALLQSTTDSIRTLDDLLKSRIKLGVEDKPYSHYYFAAQTEPTRKAIYAQKVAPKGQPAIFLDINVGVKRMREEFFAFHVECASGYKIVSDTFQENEKCGLQEIEYWQIIDPWIAIKKNSSYKELAKVAFRKLYESGIQNREFKRLYTTKPVCQSKGSNFMSVGLIDCYYAFLIMGVGTACSALLLIAEVIKPVHDEIDCFNLFIHLLTVRLRFIMKRFLFTFVWVLIAFNLNVSGTKTALTSVVKDFLSLQKPSPKITLFLCWEKGDIIKLVKTLQEDSYYVTIMNLPHKEIPIAKPVTKQVFIVDTNCDGYNYVLHEANILKLFQRPYEWILLRNSTVHISHHLEILVDSKFYIISQKTSTIFHLEAIYKISSEAEYLTNDIGIWRKGGVGFENYKFLSTIKNRTNLMGRPFNISLVVFNLDSLNHLTDYRNRHIDGISKLCYLCISKAVETMNVSQNLLIQTESSYYNKTTNLYSGVVEDLRLGRAEIGTVSFITADRISFLDYFSPIPKTRSVFIFRKPPLSYVANIYVLPFDKRVWLASFLLIAFVPLTVYLIVKWEWSNPEEYGLIGEVRNVLRLRLLDVVLMELGAVCQQGAEAEPRSGAGKIATLCIFVAFMFLYTSHSANIVALLQSTSDTIQTIDDLLNSKIKLGAEDFIYARQAFLGQTEPIRKAIYAQKIAPKGQTPNFFNLETGVDKMRHEYFAFLALTTNAYKVVADTFKANEKCTLREIDYWGLKPPHYAVKKNSSYKELVKVAFRKLEERGIQSCEVNRVYTVKPACQTEVGNFKNVELLDCHFAFVILGAGAGVSLIILLMEYLFKMSSL